MSAEAAPAAEGEGAARRHAGAPGGGGIALGGGRIALGLFLLVTAVYCLTGPGRIDSVDGQSRYDVTQSLVSVGEPTVRDPRLRAVPGLDGKRYSEYNASPSLAAVPLVWAGGLAPDPLAERRRFLFSMTSAVFGGLLAAALFRFLGELGVAPRAALGWTLATAFASLVWPLATSTLDQVQHAFFVLLAALCGLLAARRRSIPLAAAGSLALAALINYQPNFLLLVPGLALAALARPSDGRPRDRRSLAVVAVFLLGAPLGLGLMVHYNEIRFGTPFVLDLLAAGGGHPPLFGDPLHGALNLLASPGKSVFLYSPTLLLGLLGFRGLWRRSRAVAAAVGVVSATHFVFVSALSFFHGDWAWGPRYLVVILPLWGLAMPFARIPRWLGRGLVAVAVAVQLLGLATVHERFFYERGLPTFFWWPQDGFYFRESALLARPGEVLQMITEGVPAEADRFAPTHYPRLHTSFITGIAPAARAPEWMRGFRVFYLPRPWPLWALAEPPAERPVSLPLSLTLLLSIALGGGLVVRRGLALEARSAQPSAQADSG